jgi:hypothetical protein
MKQKAKELSHLLLDTIRKYQGNKNEINEKEMECARIALVGALAGVHTLYLQNAEPPEHREITALCMDSLDLLVRSIKKDVERFGIEGVEIMHGNIDADGMVGAIPNPTIN